MSNKTFDLALSFFFMRLLVVLSLVLASLAGSEVHIPHLFHAPGYSFIIPVARRSLMRQQSLSLDDSSPSMFNSEPVQKELHQLSVKYRCAGQLLGETVAPIPDCYDPSVSSSPPVDSTNPPAESVTSSSHVIHPILSASGSASVPLTDFSQNGLDILYYAHIEIGTPSQAFTVDIDTGSSDIFIPSDCAVGRCGNHKQFNSRASTTFVDRGQKIQLTYVGFPCFLIDLNPLFPQGSGQADGDLAQDVVSMQGLTVLNQSFVAVSSESSDFIDEPTDGLIGMGFSSISFSKKPTFFENLIQSRTIAKPEFSLHLARNRDGSEVGLNVLVLWTVLMDIT